MQIAKPAREKAHKEAIQATSAQGASEADEGAKAGCILQVLSSAFC